MDFVEKERFDRIFEKAQRWLTKDEFHGWLCYCYRATSVSNNKKGLAESVEGRIYTVIVQRDQTRKFLRKRK